MPGPGTEPRTRNKSWVKGAPRLPKKRKGKQKNIEIKPQATSASLSPHLVKDSEASEQKSRQDRHRINEPSPAIAARHRVASRRNLYNTQSENTATGRRNKTELARSSARKTCSATWRSSEHSPSALWRRSHNTPSREERKKEGATRRTEPHLPLLPAAPPDEGRKNQKSQRKWW